MMTNNVLSLSRSWRVEHTSTILRTLWFSVCVEVGDIDSPNLMMSSCYVRDTIVIV
jgi:hypothetical protein